ncbi:60842500-7334-439d-8e34-643b079d8795 [Thermothielavioides terrestris]|uniref:60842500-7334-439d-8e34-643b079d8795 n=1 Tax=Thermothielavioides terrestris TaxID=2587410 RepID=A0A446BDJ6_9PEZI|nr:60842500-7334-439d-8e34-643b079d8795 [Thermothielavioides terrestris]
MLRCPLQRTL